MDYGCRTCPECGKCQVHWDGDQHRPGCQYDREQAAVARAGGRLITTALASRIYRDDERHDHDPSLRVCLSGDLGQARVNGIWDYSIDPAGHNGRKGWQWAAQRAANVGRFGGFGPQDPTVTAVLLKDAEDMVSWPVYRVALGAR